MENTQIEKLAAMAHFIALPTRQQNDYLLQVSGGLIRFEDLVNIMRRFGSKDAAVTPDQLARMHHVDEWEVDAWYDSEATEYWEDPWSYGDDPWSDAWSWSDG